MSKKPELKDLPGLGSKFEEKLVAAGISTVLKLSRAKPDKLAEKIEGLSVGRAEAFISAAQEALSGVPEKAEKPAKKETKAKEKKTDTAVSKKKAAEKKAPPKEKKAVEKPKPAKKQAKPAKAKTPKKAKAEVPVRFKNVDQRLLKIAREKKMRLPQFHAENAHRWTRINRRWRKIRGIDSYTRQKKKGRIAIVSSGYRTPRVIRHLHPSLYIEVPVYRPTDLEGLDPEIHAVRIAATVGERKRQSILTEADAKLIRVLNPGISKEIGEEDLFTDIDLEED
jgi:large subunit ribosomal protein L32e